MYIIQKNNPFDVKNNHHIDILNTLYRFANESKDEMAAKTIAGFMWIKVNKEEVLSYFETYKADPLKNSELIALGDGKGMPFHLGSFNSKQACKDALDRILHDTEYAIEWAKKNNRLSDLLKTLTCGCCLESHSRAMLDWVNLQLNRRLNTKLEIMAECIKTLPGKADDEQTLLHFASQTGVPVSDSQVMRYEEITHYLITANLIEQTNQTLIKQYQYTFDCLFALRTEFLGNTEVQLFQENKINQLLNASSSQTIEFETKTEKNHNNTKYPITPDTLKAIATFLSPLELDKLTLIFVTANRFDLALSLIQHSKENIAGHVFVSRTGETALIKLLKGAVTPEKSEACLKLISLLLQRNIDIEVTDEEGFSAYAYALSLEYNNPKLKDDISRSILTRASNLGKIRGIVVMEMSKKISEWRNILVKLLKSEGHIAFFQQYETSPFQHILKYAFEQNDSELIPLYLEKITHFSGRANAIQILLNENNDKHCQALAEDLLSQLEIKEEKTYSRHELDRYYRSLADSHNKLGCAYDIYHKEKAYAYYREAIGLLKKIPSMQRNDTLSLDVYYRNFASVNIALAEEKEKDVNVRIDYLLKATHALSHLQSPSEEDKNKRKQCRKNYDDLVENQKSTNENKVHPLTQIIVRPSNIRPSIDPVRLERDKANALECKTILEVRFDKAKRFQKKITWTSLIFFMGSALTIPVSWLVFQNSYHALESNYFTFYTPQNRTHPVSGNCIDFLNNQNLFFRGPGESLTACNSANNRIHRYYDCESTDPAYHSWCDFYKLCGNIVNEMCNNPWVLPYFLIPMAVIFIAVTLLLLYLRHEADITDLTNEEKTKIENIAESLDIAFDPNDLKRTYQNFKRKWEELTLLNSSPNEPHPSVDIDTEEKKRLSWG